MRRARSASRLAAAGLPVFVHTPYLINVGSADPLIRERSVASMRYALHRGGAIGARGVVVHTGSAAGGDRDKSLLYARDCLLPVLDSIPPDGPDLLLEPMAGQGQMLCATVADLGPYLELLEWHPRAGVCLDTCHAVLRRARPHRPGRRGRGHQRAGRGSWAGPAGCDLVHANDSRDPCGSRRDRHANIGAGQIGAPALR